MSDIYPKNCLKNLVDKKKKSVNLDNYDKRDRLYKLINILCNLSDLDGQDIRIVLRRLLVARGSSDSWRGDMEPKGKIFTS
jgi:hypothetical protein